MEGMMEIQIDQKRLAKIKALSHGAHSKFEQKQAA
jgi:hypothetical protein